MCRPDEATPTEIVHAAWRLSQEDGISAETLLARFPELGGAIRIAATKCAVTLSPESLGIAIGTDYELALKTPSLFIKRDFIIELAADNSRDD
jgi:hypothetical protein